MRCNINDFIKNPNKNKEVSDKDEIEKNNIIMDSFKREIHDDENMFNKMYLGELNEKNSEKNLPKVTIQTVHGEISYFK